MSNCFTTDDYKKAIEYARGMVANGGNYGKQKFVQVVIEALYKQIPRKYWKQHQSQDCGGVDFTIDIVCDKCDHSLRYRGQKYCDECGQKIDWSDV